MKRLIEKHKGLFIVGSFALILLIVMIIACLKMFIFSTSDKYGRRLDGIENAVISKDTYKKVKDSVKENAEVVDVSVRLQGKIVYTTITFTKETSIDKAKEIATSTLKSYSEEEIAYYDFSFILTQDFEETEEEKHFIVMGYKHPKIETIGWTKS